MQQQTKKTGSHCQKLTFQPTTPPDFRNSAPPAAPRDPCSSTDNIRLPDIIYVYILSRCSRSRHHSFFFCFFFCFFFVSWGGFVFWFFFCLLLHIVLNFSLKLCTTLWWPPLWPKHVVVSYLPPYSYIIIIVIIIIIIICSCVWLLYPLFIHYWIICRG